MYIIFLSFHWPKPNWRVLFDEFQVGWYQNTTGTLADDETTSSPLRLEMTRWDVKGLEREAPPPLEVNYLLCFHLNDDDDENKKTHCHNDAAARLPFGLVTVEDSAICWEGRRRKKKVQKEITYDDALGRRINNRQKRTVSCLAEWVRSSCFRVATDWWHKIC